MEDTKAIVKIAAELMDARNRRDPVAFVSHCADDVEFTNVAGKTTRGKEALERALRSFYETDFVKKTKQVTEETTVKFVKPEVASLDIRWRTQGAIDPTGQPRRGIINAILAKDPSEGWKIKVSHNTQLVQGEARSVREESGQAVDPRDG